MSRPITTLFMSMSVDGRSLMCIEVRGFVPEIMI
jgi:hypothetical protein